jgi:hypothetical protein
MIAPDPAVPRSGEGYALLVHLSAGVGNLVLATPLLAALDMLAYEVDLLLHADYPETADLFRDWSAVGHVYAGGFPSGTAYHRLVPAVPPFYWARLGRTLQGRRGVLARPPDELFHRDEQRWYLAFAEAMGWPAGRHPVYRLPMAPSGEHGVGGSTLVLAPGCKTGEMAAKRWPHFTALAERFDDVVVVGTDDDLHDAGGKRLHFPAHVRSLAGRLTLRETAEILAAAGAVVANDSGLGHVAGAVGAPTLLLFGPTSDAVLGRFPPNVVVLRGGLPCEPCWTTARLRACAGRRDCLQTLGVDHVAAEVRRLLGPWAKEAGASLSEEPVPVPPPGAPEVRVRVASSEAAGREPTGASSSRGDPALPLVSCLMPTANRRRFVPRSIEHFLRQSYPARELVIVDDGADPVEDLVPEDPRIRYVRCPRVPTLGAKRNLACSLGRGELLAHWDDDDWMADRRLAVQVDTLLADPAAEVCGLDRLRFFDPAAEQAWEYRWTDGKRRWVGGNTMLYRRSAWERRPFAEINVGEDTRWIWGTRSSAVATVADPAIYAALVHPGNTSRKTTADSRWHRIPLDVVTREMGRDWDFYARRVETSE